jgi:uncharacterized protein (TIGR03089 family)
MNAEAVIWPMLQAKARGRGPSSAGAPVLTAYDQGARTELSAVTLANAVAKAANALVDDADIEPGDVVAVDLPWHWQRCVWLLACWSAGATVHLGRDGDQSRLQLVGPSTEVPIESTGSTWVVSLHPLGMPLVGAPANVEDAVLLARAGADDFFAPEVAGPALTGLSGLPGPSQQQAVDLVQRALAEHGQATRLLIPGELADPTLSALLLAIGPVLPGTSLVITSAVDAAECAQVAQQESATPW